MIINHNMSSLYADRVLNISNDSIMKNMEKLSSGERINRAGDDASGLAVSEKMRSQIRGLNQAAKNIQNGVSFIQTTEGYLTETTDILQRVRELAVQSANGITAMKIVCRFRLKFLNSFLKLTALHHRHSSME